MTSTKTISTTLALVTIGLVGAGAPSASAHGDDDDRVIVTGSCSAGTDWKLKVKTDDGRLEVEGEIDTNTVGKQWRWTIRHNGTVSDRGLATTTGRSGSSASSARSWTSPAPTAWRSAPITLVAVVLVTSALSRDAADEEAVADARSVTRVLGRSVAQPAIPGGLVTGQAAAIDRLDRTVLDRLLVDDVRRIKVWAADGTILYSDRTELIGAVYPLGDDELEVIDNGGTDAGRVRSPEGQPLLFEAYFTADGLTSRGPRSSTGSSRSPSERWRPS